MVVLNNQGEAQLIILWFSEKLRIPVGKELNATLHSVIQKGVVDVSQHRCQGAPLGGTR